MLLVIIDTKILIYGTYYTLVNVKCKHITTEVYSLGLRLMNINLKKNKTQMVVETLSTTWFIDQNQSTWLVNR